MYEEQDKRPRFETFYLPWGGHLDGQNRWVKLEALIPWDKVETKYKAHFKQKKGRKAKNVRVALGALLIREKFRFTDEETAEQVRENPYLQCEPPRVYRRPYYLRGYGHGKDEQVSTRGQRPSCPTCPGAGKGTPDAVGGHPLHRGKDRLFI